MNIAAFEVRDDERPFFSRYETRQGLNLALHATTLNEVTLPLVHGCSGITTLGQSHLDRSLLEALSRLGVRYVSTRTTGINHIDMQAAEEFGIRISHAKYSPHGIADFTVMLMLTCLRKYKEALFRGNVNDYSLSGLQGKEMRNLTVGIIGTGAVGAAVIHNLSGFGCRLLACSRHQQESLSGLVEYVSLEELLRQSDIVTLHVSLTQETRYIINRETLSRMKDGVILINTARGSLIEVQALIEGIESHKIGALGIDVFENEESIFHQDRRSDIISNRDMAYIRQFPNTVMTQHMAFYTVEAVESMVRCGIENILSMHRNEGAREHHGTSRRS